MHKAPRPFQELPTDHGAAGGVVWSSFPDAELPAPETRRHRRLVHGAACLGLAVTLAYLGWRVTSSLHGATLWLALPMLVLEVHALLSLGLHTLDLWRLDAVAPVEPVEHTDLRLAVLIPTYNEPREVLLPTLAAAAALQPEHQTWVLDDGGREWVAELAEHLGVLYFARTEHAHAKAGNLNALLPHLEADVIAVLDADHVASAGFLRETLGYFDDPRVALVQTPQDFYNLDSFEHVRRRRGRRYAEQALFYRGLAAGRNRWGSAFWCGTNALLRVEALREVGWVATETVTEDIHTTIRLHQHGWRSVYHNAVLARGLAASDASQYLNQRLRWGTGAMQVLRTDNPMWVRGLRATQRLSYLSTLLGWFDSWRTLGYLLLPLLTLATGALPMAAPAVQLVPWFVAALVAQRIALSALARGRAPFLPSTVFELIRLPATLAATLAIFRPVRASFSVTAKGRSTSERRRVPAPRLLGVLALGHLSALVWYAAVVTGHGPLTYALPWVAHGAAVFAVLNGALLVAAIVRIRRLRYGPERRAAVRFDLGGDVVVAGAPAALLDVSLTGLRARVAAGDAPAVGAVVAVDLPVSAAAPAVTCVATVRSTRPVDGGVLLGLEFQPDDAAQAALALALFRTGTTPRLVGAAAVTTEADAEAVADRPGRDGLVVAA